MCLETLLHLKLCSLARNNNDLISTHQAACTVWWLWRWRGFTTFVSHSAETWWGELNYTFTFSSASPFSGQHHGWAGVHHNHHHILHPLQHCQVLWVWDGDRAPRGRGLRRNVSQDKTWLECKCHYNMSVYLHSIELRCPKWTWLCWDKTLCMPPHCWSSTPWLWVSGILLYADS